MSEGTSAPFYVVGGTIAPGSPSYIARRADEELFEAVRAGDFCYVLTARQMGKSSLMARTAHRLRERGVRSAVVDLTQIGGAKSGITPEQWYYGVAHAIQRQLMPGVDSRAWWRQREGLHAPQRLSDLLSELAHADGPPAAIFIDEIDASIDFPFSDEFFAAVRACYNARALDAAFGRVTFVLLGVSTPQDLIHDQQQTPFNIGRGIELTDFTVEEALPLARGMAVGERRASALLQRVLHWTGGQPYLTQALCRDAGQAAGDNHRDADGIVDQLVERTYRSDGTLRDEHLKFINARLTAPGGPPGLLDTYRRVAAGETIAHMPTSAAHAALRLSGVVKTNVQRQLMVRNRIYAAVFTPAWATELLARRQRWSGELQPGERVGAYVIVARIGEGRSSFAFLGERTDSGEKVVIKGPKTETVTQAMMRIRLGQVLAALRHPHLAKVHEFLEYGGRTLLVEEHLAGGSLADVLERVHRVTETEACQWCRDALRALDYTHANGMVHRNIKPSNLLLDAWQQVKVSDFDLARTFWGNSRMTRTTDGAIGTPAYMSPEQINAPDSVDHFTDVYSIGVVLYELLTGDVPFDDPSAFAVYEKIIRVPPPPLRAINPQVSPALERIVLRALEKQRERRYGSAAEFALVLDRYLSDRLRPNSGADAGWPRRLVRMMRDKWEDVLANRRRH